MPRCASCGCWYGPASKERGVSFHKFPRDYDRLHRWLVSMRNNLVNKLTPEKIKELVHKKGFHWRVCSDHFQPGCFTRKSFLKRQLCPDHTTYLELEKDAVPTLFSGPGENDRKQCRPPSKYQHRNEHSRVRVIKMRKEDNRRRQEPGLKELKNAGRSGSPNNKQPRLQRKGHRKTPLCTPVQVALSEEALPTVFCGEKKTRESPDRQREKRGRKQAPEVELISSVKKTAKRKRTEDTPDVPAENLSVNLQSQLSRWKGACKALRLTDDQMAKFLLDRYYKGDQSSAYTGSQSTHKTLLLDRGLLTLWNDSMADKGFSSDKDFLWFLLLGPQKSGTDSEGLTVRDHGASDECVPVKVHYVGPGYTAPDTSQDLLVNDAANCPQILQPPTCKPSLTQSKNMTETEMTTPVPATSPNNELQTPTHKKCRKQVHVLEPKKDEPVFPKTLGKEDSHCDFVRIGDTDTDPVQPEKVGVRENGASTPFTATQKPSNTHSPNKAKRRKYLVPGPREEPAKDMNGLSTSENSNTCSQPTAGELDIHLKEKDELEIDLNDCDDSITSSHLCSSAVPIPVKQEDDHSPILSSQLIWGGTVRTKVEKEDEHGMNLCSFDNTNVSCPQLGSNIKEEDKVEYNNYSNTNSNTSQSSNDTVSIKVEKEDGLEMDFHTDTSSHLSFDTDNIKEEELETHLDMAIVTTSKHLD
ncbi:PREDICTED: uncharacterized protein LOC109473656 [Branchiostoma belcheri]|uniref:Uncharacterized protein LOC109473656 n=1 Tax=Branchiostoma belcheri TaxID=7741 RepID=A0A6P4YIF3_BRABE|nr:PREDICTED: uncharacterized protein LOC109473656 [Branchiostoma belcheri]